MRVFFLMVLVLLMGCPGPRDTPLSESEFGKTFFWQVTSSEVAFEECTDAESWSDQIQAPPFNENTFIIYRVADDGKTAVAQSCDSTDASTCTDNPLDIVYTIEGSTLTYDPERTLNNELSATCSLFQDDLWTLEDEGETLTLEARATFDLDGNEMTCTNIENAVIAESSNGKGINGCSFIISVESEFFSTDD